MKDMIIEQVLDRESIATDKLLTIWEYSVKANHHFLTEDAIASLIPYVKLGIKGIASLILAKDKWGEPIGFMGVENGKIEMLFISPNDFGKGIGTLLITHAIERLGVTHVDVNEQNPQALTFYKHRGFRVYDRSELDDQGNPFPILHMKLDKDHRDGRIK